MASDGTWARVDGGGTGPGTVDTHVALRERAIKAAASAPFASRSSAEAGSLEPWV